MLCIILRKKAFSYNKGEFQMKVEVYKGAQGKHNLKDYEETYNTFDWKDVEQAFSWSETGKMNMAYECIDKPCRSRIRG